MPNIELKNIRSRVFDSLNMEVFNGELLVVLGPNGAGKTTLLNIISGLMGYEGSVFFDGIPVDKIPTNKRQIGYLFQNLALFPHLDVASNIGYSLMVKGEKKGDIERRVYELLRLMKIGHLENRYPKNLSGGEKQRVALARALATSPQVLLLDEPFNSIDLEMCKCLRKDICQIQKKEGITTIFVTHNIAYAEEIGDRIIVLDEGRIHQEITKKISFSESVINEGDNSVQDCLSCKIDCYCKR